MNKLLCTEPDLTWESIAPHFDQAVGELSEAEQDALLLRYFERKSAREMAEILRISDDAAQKRVNRAIEHLRAFFTKRGIAVGASGLAVAISANAVQAAPLGLATTVASAVALAGSAIHASSLTAATKMIAMTTIKKSLIAATLVVVAGTGVYQAHRVSDLQRLLQTLQEERASLHERLQRSERERDGIATDLAAARIQIAKSGAIPADLLKLRAEVTRLRGDSQALAQRTATEPNNPMGATAQSWLSRVDQLKKRAERMPDKRIPELELLTEKEWLDAVKEAKQLKTDADFRQALHKARNSAKNLFGDLARSALTKYAQANGGLLPADWWQLQPYFQNPVDESILQRYALLQTGRLNDVPPDGFVFAEKAAPVDDEYDSFYEFRMNGTRSSSINPTSNAIEDAAIRFAEAHNGLLPSNPSELAPYFKQSIDPFVVQKILDRIPPGVTTLDQLKSAGTK